jgi:isoquinoline 1-oxidoreductase beta subunit
MADGALNPSDPIRPSRRGVLTAGAAAGGGLLIGFRFGDVAQAQNPKAPYFEPNAFIKVGRDGMVTLTLPKSEMGQGINTTIAMLIAEELAVGLEQVTLVPGPPDKRLALGLLGQVTGGSMSVMSIWTPLRQAGATTRVMLVAAAAQAWGVTADSCTAGNCQVIHVSTGRRLDYGKLVDIAAVMPAPPTPALKPISEFELIGKSRNRLDAAGKVDGSLKYAIDIVLPNMKFAAVKACPVRGGKVKTLDDKDGCAVKGVYKVINGGPFVAVVAAHMGAAQKGLSKLNIVWDEGPNAALSQADMAKILDDASTRAADAEITAYKRTVAEAALAAPGVKTIEAVYRTPFLAHATMEPMNCAVHIRKDKADVWVGTQGPPIDQAVVAELTGLPLEAITIHNHQMGGGFGRRSEPDATRRAVLIGMQVDGPVKVVWSREEDIQQDFPHPATVYRLSAALDPDGQPTAWRHTYAAGSAGWRKFVAPPAVAGAPPPAPKPPKPEKNTLGYDIPNVQGYVHQEIANPAIPSDAPNHGHSLAVPIGFWRGVEENHRVFVVESFMDELAHAAGKDPVEYRLALLTNPRAKGVLKLVADKSDWATPLPAGRGRGLSVFSGFGSHLATVVELTVSPKGAVKVDRVVCAVDCGVPINPRNIEAQIFGGGLFGLTACLRGQITYDKGRIEQSNFNDYQPLRMGETPKFEVHVMPSTESPGGLGEAATAGMHAAVANAIFAATGKRVRELPISNTSLV